MQGNEREEESSWLHVSMNTYIFLHSLLIIDRGRNRLRLRTIKQWSGVEWSASARDWSTEHSEDRIGDDGRY